MPVWCPVAEIQWDFHLTDLPESNETRNSDLEAE